MKRYPKILSIYFGLPGSGKTTIAQSQVTFCNKHKIPVYSNVPLAGSLRYSVDMLGKYQIENCHLIIDEAGLEFNNRSFKSFTNEQLLFFKLHRHYGVSISVFSQCYNDMDLKIRSLAQQLYIVKRSIIPYHTVTIPIKKQITIDEEKHDIIDGYFFDKWFFQIFTSKRIFNPFYWGRFNSYECPMLKEYKFENW